MMDRRGSPDTMQKAAQNLQDAILNARKIRRGKTMMPHDTPEEASDDDGSVARRRSHSKGTSALALWLQEEYLESSDDEVSMGSTLSDAEDGGGDDVSVNDNQVSPCNSPVLEVRHALSAGAPLSPRRDETESPCPAMFDAAVSHVQAHMAELELLRSTLMQKVQDAVSHIDTFVGFVTGQPSVDVDASSLDFARVDEIVAVWEHRLTRWRCAHEVSLGRQHEAASIRLQEQHWKTMATLQIAHDHENQMLQEEFLSRRWHDLMETSVPSCESRGMEVEEWLSRCLEWKDRALTAEHSAHSQADANELLRLQLASIDTRLQEAISQVQLHNEIAQHAQAAQVHEMKEIEALNYKLLNTLVRQDEQLRLKEAVMARSLEQLRVDREELAADHMAFEVQKHAILKELKGVCDYFSDQCETSRDDKETQRAWRKIAQCALDNHTAS
ncbi:Aste57867_15656 [Aphanomyces stellatus]|uniref:Aste57867_15656 protein n=1 Tax=Aphanomyces stellatus TaxID=120398 RepID=A0A485L4J6_9STRA|nr:hypothetical protein As57867_015600 [Aphanomyces stellatus]VFT92451.1 Aste57867_15656 [Aphanomyces stellatus]